jgi:hypothetical protein
MFLPGTVVTVPQVTRRIGPRGIITLSTSITIGLSQIGVSARGLSYAPVIKLRRLIHRFGCGGFEHVLSAIVSW